MIAYWMLFAIALAGLLAAAAWSGERALRESGRPVRWPWALALLLAVAVPFTLYAAVALMGSGGEAGAAAVGSAGTAGGAIGAEVIPSAAGSGGGTSWWSEALARVDPVLLGLWPLLSAAVALRFGAAAWTNRRRAQAGRATAHGGHQLSLTRETGPAVVGLFEPRIVLPAWFASLDADEREMVLRHEREHIRARDPLLLMLAQASLVLMPWNPVLWWMARRLGAAVEMDCDRRLLQQDVDPARYGELLLAAKGAGLQPSVVTAFGRSESLLERRVEYLMDAGQPERSGYSAAAGGIAIILLLGGAGLTHLFGESGASRLAVTVPGLLQGGEVSSAMQQDAPRQLNCHGATADELPGPARIQVRVLSPHEATDLVLRVQPSDSIGDSYWPSVARLDGGDGLSCVASASHVQLDLDGTWGTDTLELMVSRKTPVAVTKGTGPVPTATVDPLGGEERALCRVDGTGPELSCTVR